MKAITTIRFNARVRMQHGRRNLGRWLTIQKHVDKNGVPFFNVYTDKEYTRYDSNNVYSRATVKRGLSSMKTIQRIAQWHTKAVKECNRVKVRVDEGLLTNCTKENDAMQVIAGLLNAKQTARKKTA